MRKKEQGAALIFTAIMMAGLLAFSGAAIDIGLMLHQRTSMQMAADAAALAGARGLITGRTQAIAAALSMAASNGYTIAASNITCSGAGLQALSAAPAPSGNYGVLCSSGPIPTPKPVATPNSGGGTAAPTDVKRVKVFWSSPAGLVMAPFFKLLNVQVGVAATAEYTGTPNGGGVVPIGIPKQAFNPGREYVLKPGTGSPNNRGNFGPLSLNCRGAINYQNYIVQGSNLPVKVGDYLYTEPGNMVGPTEKGFVQRIGNDQISLEDAIAKGSPRLVTMPILDDGWWNASTGMSPELVVGFARFYVTYTAKGEVHGRFVNLVAQSVIPAAGMQYAVKLVE